MERDYTRNYRNYQGSEPPPIEMEKYGLTKKMEDAYMRGAFKEAMGLAYKLAGICRGQGKESDARMLEHEAFLFQQKQIYQDAAVSTNAFADVPYVEKLKDAMTEAADQAAADGQMDYAACYKRLTARLCKAQGKERDSYLLDCAVHSIQARAQAMRRQRGLTEAELESVCLQRIAGKYGKSLWEG